MVPNLFFLLPIYFFHPCLPVIFLVVLNIKGYNFLEGGKKLAIAWSLLLKEKRVW